MALRPDQQIAVTLTAQAWNVVLAQLDEGGPHRVVAPLIHAIRTQCQAHDRPEEETAGVVPLGRPAA